MLKFALVCDGTSDLCLEDLINWLMQVHFADRTYRVVAAQEVIPAHEDLATRIAKTIRLYEPTAILCHRDAENVALPVRTQEIRTAAAGSNTPTIPVVPVRMTEAWLLFDQPAIRAAADNRNGTVALQLPSVANVQALPDPKASLCTALKAACELNARRKRKFSEHRARRLVSTFIDDFTPLRQLEAFQQFEDIFVQTVSAL